MRTMIAAGLALALGGTIALGARLALASQNALSSPITGTVSGLDLTNNYNGALDSLLTNQAGAAAPTNSLTGVPEQGQFWFDTATSPPSLQIYDGGQWLTIGSVDDANHWWEPVVGGGAGSIASASTTDLGSLPYSFLTITGTATIDSFGSSAPVGSVKYLVFSGAATLHYNASTMVLPTAANIVAAAGDAAVAVQTASGAWQVNYFPISGKPVASLATVPSGAVMAFALGSCPTGWAVADGSGGRVNMRGTVARGYDPGNTRDPNGSSQSIGSYETDMFQQHTEASPGAGFFVANGGTATLAFGLSAFTETTVSSTGMSNSGNYGPETRAKSTILLYCQKS